MLINPCYAVAYVVNRIDTESFSSGGSYDSMYFCNSFHAFSPRILAVAMKSRKRCRGMLYLVFPSCTVLSSMMW